MPAHNVMQNIGEAMYNKKTLSANSTLTVAEILQYNVFQMASYTILLPSACSALTNRQIRVANNSTAANLTLTEGFGGGTTSTDIIAVANGQFYDLWCDGTDWHYGGAAAAG